MNIRLQMLMREIKRSFKNDALKKLIIFTTAGLIIISSMIFKHQRNEIKELENQLILKQESHEREFDYSETVVVAKTIKEKLNENAEYKVFDSTMSIKHKYILTEEAFLGFDRQETITGTATCYYQYIVPLEKAEVSISSDMKKVIITLPEVTLDREATHRQSGTFLMLENECSSSFLSNRNAARKAMRYWEDTYDERANDRIESLYSSAGESERLKKVAINEVENLLNSLNLDSLGVKIIVK